MSGLVRCGLSPTWTHRATWPDRVGHTEAQPRCVHSMAAHCTKMEETLQEDSSVSDPTSDFMKDYQTLARQSWEAFTRQLPSSPAANPFASPAFATSGNDTLERTLSGLKGYFDWMQGVAAASGAGSVPTADWHQQLQQMFGGATPPFAQAFSGIDTTGAEGFVQQWQSWMQAAQRDGLGDFPGAQGPTPAFGLNREQQMQQQAMSLAVFESLQASARYQTIIQRANAQGMERLQDKLAQHAEPGRQIDSLKALYDLWVDAVEEAYAEIALSTEFRDAYGEMVNAQMRVRQLQQQQTEQLCQQLGMPTRSEVSSLGERLQALRRELAALKRQLDGDPAGRPATGGRPPATPSRSTAKKAAAKKSPAKQATKKDVVKKAAAKAVRKLAAGKVASGRSPSKSRPGTSRKRK